MNKIQVAVLASALGLFLLLYFTCSTKPPAQKALEKSRALSLESTDVQSLLEDAKAHLSGQGAAAILPLEAELEKAATDAERSEIYKSLSGKWYELGETALAGHYAEEAAGIDGTGEAWGIAGTTYTLCAQKAETEKVRQFCASRALTAFESAISVAPGELSHRINLALTYVEFPASDDPMKGILLLRELDEQNPDNPAVLFQLGRLSIRTGQWERAVERLERVVELAPDHRNAWCLLEQAYQGTGQAAKAEASMKRCQELN